jgi:hypothetical protein
MKKVTSFGPMKGILKLAQGEVLEQKVDKQGIVRDEIVHDFMTKLQELDGEDVVITIKHVEEVE